MFFIVPEAATSLILNEITPCKEVNMDSFQEFVLDKQLDNKKLYNLLTRYYKDNKIVLIFDRGIMDQLAYIQRPEFQKKLDSRNLSICDVMTRYDIVLHSVSAAVGTDFYTTENNAARKETKKEAIIVDGKTLDGWVGHPNLHVVDNTTNFEDKIQKVLDIVLKDLNNEITTRKKFLIEPIDINNIKKQTNYSQSDIVQTYLKGNDKERRIKQVNNNGDFSFYYSEKKDYENGLRSEKERRISSKDYLTLLQETDISKNVIIKDVTNEKKYRNAEIAKK